MLILFVSFILIVGFIVLVHRLVPKPVRTTVEESLSVPADPASCRYFVERLAQHDLLNAGIITVADMFYCEFPNCPECSDTQRAIKKRELDEIRANCEHRYGAYGYEGNACLNCGKKKPWCEHVFTINVEKGQTTYWCNKCNYVEHQDHTTGEVVSGGVSTVNESRDYCGKVDVDHVLDSVILKKCTYEFNGRDVPTCVDCGKTMPMLTMDTNYDDKKYQSSKRSHIYCANCNVEMGYHGSGLCGYCEDEHNTLAGYKDAFDKLGNQIVQANRENSILKGYADALRNQ